MKIGFSPTFLPIFFIMLSFKNTYASNPINQKQILDEETKTKLYQSGPLIKALLLQKTKKPAKSSTSPTKAFTAESIPLNPQTTEDIAQLAYAFTQTLRLSNKTYLKKAERRLLEEESIQEDVDANKYLKTALMGTLIIPQEAHLTIIGDLHGDLGPIKALINKLSKDNKYDPTTGKILDPLIYVVFLGDFIDRGPDSLAVLANITKLLIANPEKITLIRGNHETNSMAQQPYSFLRTLAKVTKNYATAKTLLAQFIRGFAHLPLIIFIQHGDRNHSLAATHGGIDPELTPEQIGFIQNKLNANKTTRWILKSNPEIYLWSDMSNTDETSIHTINESRNYAGYELYHNNIKHWLLQLGLKTLFRGHQQYNEIFIYKEKQRLPYALFTQGYWLGIANIWDDQVITCNVAPNTNYYNNPNYCDEEDYYSTVGTLALLYRAPKDFTNPIKKFPNIFPRTLKSLPDTVLEGLYFHPKTHELLSPQ